MQPPTARYRIRRRVVIAAIILLPLIAVACWYIFRPPAASPPAIDLSHAEPDVAAAVQSALDGVRGEPRSAAAWGKLGMVLRAHDFEADSVQSLREAERLDPSDPRWPYLQGLTLILARPDEGLACLRRAAERSPANRPEPRQRLSEVLLELGRIDEAEETARPVGDSNLRAALISARVAASRGDWAGVLSRTEPLRDEPQCRKQATMLHGQALARLGRTSEAQHEMKRAAELPDDSGWDDPYVREVERLRVGSAAMLAESARLISEGQVQSAIPLLERAMRQSPDSVDSRLLLGQAFQLAGDARSAQETLRELTRMHPDSVDGWFHLGVAQFTLGEFGGAATSFANVVRLKPDHALGHFNLAHSLRKKGDRPGAIAAAEVALRCRPDYEAAAQLLKELREGK
jgi:tetratricopeptide (TPR) repeat protein